MVSGLMWQISFDHNRDGFIDYDDKLTFDEILDAADTSYPLEVMRTGGFHYQGTIFTDHVQRQ